jgi:hypothetical protein
LRGQSSASASGTVVMAQPLPTFSPNTPSFSRFAL